MPEFPPGSVCIHSTCNRKFSYCFSVRITLVGWPLQTSMPFSHFQVSEAVLTLTHLVRSLPLHKSRYTEISAASVPASSTRRRLERLRQTHRLISIRRP